MKTNTCFSRRALAVVMAVVLMAVVPVFAQQNFSNEVLVYFVSGVKRGPLGQPALITSPAVQAALSRFNIAPTAVESAFPNFAEADTLMTAPDGRTIKLLNMAKIFRVRVSNGVHREQVIEALSTLPQVLFAEPNGTARPYIDPNDQYFGYQWGLKNGTTGQDIHATQAWDIYTGNSNNIFAIVDGGIDGSHPDLSGKVSGDAGYGWEGHGIHVAGIASAKTNNTTGIAGVDWSAQLHAQRIDNTDDAGTYQAIVDAVNYSPNVYVLNNSWGLTNPQGQARYSTVVESAFAYAYKMNRVAVAAMGNDQGSQTQYPAGFGQGIIAVGATDQNDAHPGFSNTGNHIDVSAPGVSILSTYRNGNFPGDLNYHYNSGTSMAAPHVAGIASLLKGYNPNLCNDDIEQIIRVSADDKGDTGWDQQFGTGRVNARKALDYLRAPYTLNHLSANGMTYYNEPYLLQGITVYGVPGLPDGFYDAYVYVVYRNVTFPAFSSTPYVWGRGVGTVGYSYEEPNFGMGWCEVVPGSVTTTGAQLRTYVYNYGYLVDDPLGYQWFDSRGFFPTYPENVAFAYTVLGTPLAKSSGSTLTEDIAIPEGFILSQNFPNPFNPETAIRFGLPQDEHVQLAVIDLLGREVRKLVDNDFSAGYHSVVWDGKDNAGNVVPSGVYIYQIVAGAFQERKKLALVR